MIYSILSITTRATSLSAVTMMRSLSFMRFSSAKCHLGGCCGRSGDEVLELLDLGVLVL